MRCGIGLRIWIEQEPGSGGKESAENTIRTLGGFIVGAERVTGDKVTRAGPLASQAEAGNVALLVASWTEAFLAEAQNFDGVHGFSDQIDAAGGAYNKLTAETATTPLMISARVTAPPPTPAEAEAREADRRRVAEQVVLDEIASKGVFWPTGDGRR